MSDVLIFGRVQVRPALRQLLVDGKPVPLGSRAFDILLALVNNSDRVVSKRELMDLVWPGLVVEENNLSVQMSALRRAVGSDAIATVTGRGYRFTLTSDGDATNASALLSPASADLELAANQPKVAVLPFECDGPTSYFGDGIPEEIISALAANRSLFVVARSSTLRYRGTTLEPREIARELGVRYLVCGTVRRADRRLRLLAELVDARDGRVLWSQRFEGADADIFDFQSEISSSIAGAIDPRVLDAELERVSRSPTENLSAYDCVLRGLALQVTFQDGDFAAAGESFQRAIGLDPRYAQAHSHLAWWHNLRVGEGRSADFDGDRRKSEELSMRGMFLDPGDALVLAVAAHVQGFVLKRLDVAMDMFAQALSINPCCALAWSRSAITANLLGGGEEARRRVENAFRLSPFDRQVFSFLTTQGTASFVLGDFDDAIAWYEKARRANPRYKAAWRMLVACLALAGRSDEARREGKAFLEYEPTFRVGVFSSWYPMREPHVTALLQGMRLAGLPD